MLKKSCSYQFAAAAATAWLLCACGAETAAPTSRVNPQGNGARTQSPSSGTSAGPATTPGTGPNMAAAGSGGLVLQTPTNTGVTPKIGDSNVCEVVQLV